MAKRTASAGSTQPPPGIAQMVLSRRLGPLPLADQVYLTLQDGMLEGTFPPGTHLVQDAIAEQLGVSRTPVRDALIRLSQDELVVASGARGYMVVEPPVAALADVLAVRAILEPVGAVEALDYMSERDFLTLTEINAQFTEVASPTGRQLYEFNQQFHMGLVEKCPNTYLVRVLDDIWTAPRSRWIWKRAFEHGFDMLQSAKEHEEIIAVARTRDRESYGALLREHLHEVQIELVDQLES